MTALLVTLGSFALILVLARVKVPLPGAIVSGGIVCGLSLRMSADEMLLCMAKAAVQPKAVGLLLRQEAGDLIVRTIELHSLKGVREVRR